MFSLAKIYKSGEMICATAAKSAQATEKPRREVEMIGERGIESEIFNAVSA